MKLMNYLRKKAFWTLDKLRGQQIKRGYRSIKKIDLMDSSDPYIKKYQNKVWLELKNHACNTTEFYKEFRDKNFIEFPVISKNDIKENQGKFMSRKFSQDDLIQMSTSGSTGTPFVCYQDVNKKKRVNAEIIYYSEKVGYEVGKNLSYIRTVVKQNKKSEFRQFLQNQTLLQCEKLNDEGIRELIRKLEEVSKNGSITLLAYASTYTTIKDYAKRNGIKSFANCHIGGVISGSEMLYDSTREAIKKLFKTEVISRYSNEENGVIGQDEGINNNFTVNEADYLVEILDDDGQRVPDGTLGRIVVTDFFNYAMPMIRYDTGDMGAIVTKLVNGREKKVICNFSGRKVDLIYDTSSNALSPHVITNAMWSFPDIKQFQFIQKGKNNYLLKLNLDGNFQRSAEIIETLKNILGDKACIDIEKVEEIPVLASGKRRYIVNEWRK